MRIKEDPRMVKKSNPKKRPGKVVPKEANLMPKEYEKFLGELKERIRTAQLRASVAVNRELVLLYWQDRPGHPRLWYARETVGNGWSRNVLVHWIESDLYERQGKASTNFVGISSYITKLVD